MSLPIYQLLRIEASLAARRVSSSHPFRSWHSFALTGPQRDLPPKSKSDSFLKQGRSQHNAVRATSDSKDDNLPPTDQVCTSAYGQVMAAQANFVRIKVDRLDGSDDPPPQKGLLCVVRALLKKIKQEVLVGDHVKIIGIDWVDGRGMVEEVLPRQSQLLEPPIANVTHILLVFSLDLPPFQPSAATRYLIAADIAGIPVTVALNKSDLLSEEEVQDAVQRLASWGYKAIPISVKTGQGLAELQKELTGQVAVLAGPSGAGKSSIINALRLESVGMKGTLEGMAAQPSIRFNNNDSSVDEEDARGEQEEESCVENSTNSNGSSSPIEESSIVELQAVGSVSTRFGKGKHTTRNVGLFEMQGGGLLADTPGFNQPDIAIPANELALHFPEIQSRLEQERCAFQNCQHVAEPGCVVQGDWERYQYYTDMHAELKQLEDLASQRAISKRRREGNVRVKSRAGGKVGIEARLETKAHRRVSRREGKQLLQDYVRDVEEEAAEDKGDDSDGDEN